MTPRERFVHFVAVFSTDDLRLTIIDEVMRLDPSLLEQEGLDEQGDRIPPALERPMEAAHEYVRYRTNGSPRPDWYPRILDPSKLTLVV